MPCAWTGVAAARCQESAGGSPYSKELKEHLKAYGSAIVSAGGEIGAHVIIVDAIDDDGVDIRDSFHGWSIKITKEAFLSRYSGGPLIQLQ